MLPGPLSDHDRPDPLQVGAVHRSRQVSGQVAQVRPQGPEFPAREELLQLVGLSEEFRVNFDPSGALGFDVEDADDVIEVLPKDRNVWKVKRELRSKGLRLISIQN